MKRIVIILFLILGVSANAQETFTIDNQNSTLNIAGFQFIFGDKKSDSKTTVERVRRNNTPRVNSNLLGKIRWGYNFLLDNELAALNKPQCAHFSMDLYTIKVFLDSHRNISLATGVQFVYNDLVFADNVSMRSLGESAIVYDLGQSVKKSKLAGRYLGVPLYLNLRSNRSEFSLMAFANYNMNSFVKTKGGYNHKEDFRGLNEFQYGFGVSLSFEDFGLYALYTKTPFFRPGLQIDNLSPSAVSNMNTASVGIIFNFD